MSDCIEKLKEWNDIRTECANEIIQKLIFSDCHDLREMNIFVNQQLVIIFNHGYEKGLSANKKAEE